MAFCPKCGGEVTTGMPYCPACNAPLDTKAGPAPMVLGVIGLIFAVLLPIICYPCSIVGLVLASQEKKKGKNAKVGMILNILALVVAVLNSAAGAALAVAGMM